MEKVRDYMVEPIQFSAAKPFVIKWHYCKSVHGLHISQCFGLFKEGNFGFPKMIGAMMYGVPSSMPGQTTSKYGNDSGKILELNRNAAELLNQQYGPINNQTLTTFLEKEMKKPTVKYAGNIGKEGMYTNKKPKRARGPKGRYKGDDKSTPNVNEAWVGGKAPKRGKK